MKQLVQVGDRLAIGISLVCAVHCFLTPFLLALLPSLKSLAIAEDEVFHTWLLIAVLPTSLFTLTMGCRRHKKFMFFGIGCLGLGFLLAAGFIIDPLFGCEYERWATLAGSCLVAFAHFNNFMSCRAKACDAH